mmetsp:Transcript_21624/g.69637  ORF Transcript_21624/g.69637 Transcript_21624/m.69637 type:complete len:462 (-) Transcript_21624:113-1498(-)|eukprot:CAMPEP_0118909054 /NCGR_PEP_ID=MMETSP1166-20130328/11803_1 /TAXON_ID=1104430 /ORGANISM="Chrysoreinhardia sp, Strain CCMP3193" /LENGTH=461 /DNA_ID=CAMNT_0006848467 /DNA_START=18 /DNA_END=1403 /DNA_ORIENTATION=+
MEFIREKSALLRSQSEPLAAAEYEAMGELFEGKLWHELTLKVSEVVRALSGMNHLDLLDLFVAKFEQRMNQLRYAEILCLIVSGAASQGFLGPAEGIARLERAVEEKKARLGVEASLYVDMEAAMLTMEAGVTSGRPRGVAAQEAATTTTEESPMDVVVADDDGGAGEAKKADGEAGGGPPQKESEEEASKDDEPPLQEEEASNLDPMMSVKLKLEAAKPIVDALTGTTETAVFEKYYRASAGYYKRAGPPEAFYRAALSLLAYSSSESTTPEERFVLATDMSLAALTGDGVYNFGEVLATPVLAALAGTPRAWLGDLLSIFHAGDVDAFAKVCHDFRQDIELQPALVAKFDFVKEKLAILALMNLLFETPSHARTVPFAAVAKRAQLPVDQVEWLAMRAMALGLVRGQIDQVDATIHFDWVQPRVLDQHQIKHLVTQLDTLSDKSKNALNLLTDQTVDLL